MGKELCRPINWQIWHHPEWDEMHPQTYSVTKAIWEHTRVVMMDVHREVRRQYNVQRIAD